MRYAILLAILTLSPLSGLPSCASSPSQEQPKDQPKDAIERLYRAVAAQECDAVMAEFTRAYRDTLTGAALPCSELIEKVGAYPLQEVLKTAVDGRQAGARLVRVRLQGRTADVIFRVEVEAGQWKIASM